jgi:hypothetical protein
LRKLLGIDPKSTNTGSDALDSLDSLLRNGFSRRQSIGERPEPTSLDLLRADADFSGWWEAQDSRLFLAGGVNWRPGSSLGTLNWLSEGALLVIKELREKNRNVAYYLVQSTPIVGKTHRQSLRHVLANLIFQIAVMREDGFRSELDSLEILVNSPEWNKNDADGFMEAARNLLHRLFSTFTAQCQICKCTWSDDDGQDTIDIHTALGLLLSVISEVTCRVKILVTVDAPSAGKFDQTGPPLYGRERECLVFKHQWRQESRKDRLPWEQRAVSKRCSKDFDNQVGDVLRISLE